MAVVTFNGTGIAWIGVLDPYSGLATVYVDGIMSIVDTWGPATLYRQKLFTASGLVQGPHTLSIEVTHTRHAYGLGSWVWIDAFDIENGSGVTGGVAAATTGRTEQITPAMIYTGMWLLNVSTLHSGGSSALAVNPGSSATIKFNGGGVTWIAYRDEWSGIADVYVDGVWVATVDSYLSPALAQTAAYVVSGLVPGVHTLTIEATGTQNPGSGGAWVWVDAFDVVGSTVSVAPPSAVGVNPGAGGGSSQTFTSSFSDPVGWQNLAAVDVLFNNVPDGRNACSVVFTPSGASSGSVYLTDDTGATGGPASGMLVPGSGSVSNSQCTVNAAGSSVSGSGSVLTLTLAIVFSASFSGDKVTFLAAQDKSSSGTGWQALGTWTVPGSLSTVGPLASGVSPARSSSQSRNYTFTFTDTYGAQDISVATALINTALDSLHACYFAFVPSSPVAGVVYLVVDPGETGSPYETMPIPGFGGIANSQCAIAATGSSVNISGNTMTLTLPIAFTPAFAGNRIFFAAVRSETLDSGWHAVGTVTVPQ